MPTIFEAKKAQSSNFRDHESLLTQTKHKYFHSFCVNPRTRFDGQNEGEKVILLLRKHPVTQIPWIIATIVLFFAPLFLNVFLGSLVVLRQLIFINILWYAVLYAYVIINVLNYIFNVGIVTNFRIVDIDFNSVLYKEIDETILSKVEDVTTKTGGFVRSIFRFGDLYVQTAGTNENIEFMAIPDPTEAATIINELMRLSLYQVNVY